ncbi:hypothetical protein BGZ80_008730 [Entomortierella chlamydospora]|uniref:F-box domain-containing protein n=1 Tax=Entomortierella chlamydospora TaxID=101097 RepID=A0A9P6MX02_9FUNG|nr:hypothetical protein BGZ79_010420 [Entomortierella chlamydospora]KAG0016973.1 hypothetical protein BGZ80_008730 [Entomortierella chlamydospora]
MDHDTHMSDSSHSAERPGFTHEVPSKRSNRKLSLTDMPVEVLTQIALKLPCKEFGRFLQVNRSIHDIANSHYIWHQRFATRFGQSILKSKLEDAKTKPASNTPSRPPSPRFPPDANTNSSNNGSPSTVTSQIYQGYYHNHQDPTSSTSTPVSSVPSSPQSAHSQILAPAGNSSSSDNDERPNDDIAATKDQSVEKGKGRKIDLRKTTEISKDILIELYRQYSRMTLPAEDMQICHMGDRYWKMIESRSSTFGRLAQLQSVWWMDVVAIFRGVPPGRYKVQWRVKVTSDAPIVNSEFRAVLFDKDEEGTSDKPDSIHFKPRNVQEFTERTDTKVTKADRKPFRNLFRKDFTVLELPGDLIIEDDFQNVFLQIRNHEGWKSGLCIDYVRLVDMDDPEKSIHRLVFRGEGSSPPTSGSEEEVNDEGEEYYVTGTSSSLPWFQTALGISPDRSGGNKGNGGGGNKGNGGGGNSSRNNHAATNKKLADTTSSIKNLQIGTSTVSGSKGTNSTSANNSNANGNNKNGKKPKKNTSNGAKSASTPAPAKKSTGPVLLGLPDSPMEHQDDVDPYITKIGGVPSWLDQDMPAPSKYGICGACGKNLYLILQAYVPLERSPYDRVVYVWACNQRLCMRKNGSFRVIRALKLNPEYAQKLEKKSKPAAAPAPITAPGVVTAVNPFAASGAFDMGSALFGGSGSGFNPFAPPSSTVNPFAPPMGFGVGAPAPAVISFASITSTNVPKEDPSSDSEEEEEEEDVASESTEWPENLPAFDPHYLYITEEVLEKSDSIDDDISQRYGHLLALEEAAADGDDEDGAGGSGSGGATWSGEAYEKAALPKGVDKAFQKFTERVQSWPEQCVRYDFPGVPLLFSYSDRTAQSLLPPNVTQHSKHTTPSAHRIPKCPACKGPRGFEFQLMPNLLSMLDVTSKKYLSEEEKQSLKERKGAQVFDIGMEWGTILVYSCVEDCFGMKAQNEESSSDNQKVKYFEEVALVQFED